MNVSITNIQRFSIHDGPGVRTTVFFKGCPLRCRWCHNPETQRTKQELLFYDSKCSRCGRCFDVCGHGVHIFEPKHHLKQSNCVKCGKCIEACGSGALEFAKKELTVDEIVNVLVRDIPFYGKDGGVTLSGGEPLMQPKQAIDILTRCKEKGIGTAIETCGFFDSSYIDSVVKVTDLFLFDIKDTDRERHHLNMGKYNDDIIKNLKTIDKLGGKTRVRCIIVNGINANEEHYSGIAKLVGELSNCEGVEIFPYHSYGISKFESLGRNYDLGEENVPSRDQLYDCQMFLKNKGINVIKNKYCYI